MTVSKVSDRTFLLHLGGKIETAVKIPLRNRDDLSMAYTPGVARVSMAIARNPEDVRRLTVKRNSVAVVTDGSAVLGLGNIGPYAAMPVMEGKAALFKRFAGIDAWPVCLDTQDTDEIVRTVQIIAPGLRGHQPGGHQRPAVLRGRARGCASCWTSRSSTTTSTAPRSWSWPPSPTRSGWSARSWARSGSRSRARARRAPRCSGCCSPRVPRDVIVCDDKGAIYVGRPGLDDNLRWVAGHTNAGQYEGNLAGALRGADVFIGVSAPRLLTGADIAAMNDDAIVFALANPDPEVDPDEAAQHAAVVATGRSDYPNQINNVLVFPGVFRGLLDAQSRTVSDDMMVAAARALAGVVSPAELGPHYIIPSVFNANVSAAVAAAVRDAAGGRPARP